MTHRATVFVELCLLRHSRPLAALAFPPDTQPPFWGAYQVPDVGIGGGNCRIKPLSYMTNLVIPAAADRCQYLSSPKMAALRLGCSPMQPVASSLNGKIPVRNQSITRCGVQGDGLGEEQPRGYCRNLLRGIECPHRCASYSKSPASRRSQNAKRAFTSTRGSPCRSLAISNEQRQHQAVGREHSFRH